MDGSAAIPDDDVDVVTFGCRLTAVESQAIRERALADGVRDTVVFNTCAVTGEAVRQARQAIRKARRERPGARLIVTGCAAQIDPKSFADMAEVEKLVGVQSVLKKPFDLETLNAAVGNELARARAQG